MPPAGAEAAAAERFLDFPVNDQLNDTITLSDDEEVSLEPKIVRSFSFNFLNRRKPHKLSCRRGPNRMERTELLRWTTV